jgi:hypothetical protein
MERIAILNLQGVFQQVAEKGFPMRGPWIGCGGTNESRSFAFGKDDKFNEGQ